MLVPCSGVLARVQPAPSLVTGQASCHAFSLQGTGRRAQPGIDDGAAADQQQPGGGSSAGASQRALAALQTKYQEEQREFCAELAAGEPSPGGTPPNSTYQRKTRSPCRTGPAQRSLCDQRGWRMP